MTAVLAVCLAIVSGRSASLSGAPRADKDQENLIVLEAPAEGPEDEQSLLEGNNLSSNILDDNRRGRASSRDSTPEPFSLVVPVARNFSSLKELFEILREDSGKPPRKAVLQNKNQTYVKDTEGKSSDYMFFFAS